MSEFFVETRGLSVGYNGKPLIEQIQLKLNQGQILTLIGPNGSGKSTILKSITGQLEPLGGAVYLDFREMNKLSRREIAEKMAIVMTDRIHPELMTCRDVVSTGRYPYTGRLGILAREDKAKVRRALEQVNGLELAEQMFANVSDGQRQRVLLARALCQEPKLIVLDEPTSFLDIRYKLELLSILKDLVRRQNLAVILSLHELDLAQRISDIVVCVHDHQIERVGPPEEVFTSDYIPRLYGLTQGSYHPEFGHLELERTAGAPQVFVIGGGGSGISVYRRLQREGVPFAAGVLHRNDVEYLAAKDLAVEVIGEQAFEPIGEETLRRAMAVLESCPRVICTIKEFGTMNQGNRRLLERAVKLGKEVEYRGL